LSRTLFDPQKGKTPQSAMEGEVGKVRKAKVIDAGPHFLKEKKDTMGRKTWVTKAQRLGKD